MTSAPVLTRSSNPFVASSEEPRCPTCARRMARPMGRPPTTRDRLVAYLTAYSGPHAPAPVEALLADLGGTDAGIKQAIIRAREAGYQIHNTRGHGYWMAEHPVFDGGPDEE